MARVIQKSSGFSQQLANAVTYYATEASSDIAHRFLDTVEKGITSIAEPPTAYERYMAAAQHKGLAAHEFRCLHLSPFPYTIFYRIVSHQHIILEYLYAQRQQINHHGSLT